MRFRVNPGIAILAVAISLISCGKKSMENERMDILRLPSQAARDFTSTYTDSGKLQLVFSAPIMERYEKSDPPYTEFRSGVDVQFHDGNTKPVASVTARYAKLHNDKNLWELQDSVVAFNEAGEKLETELLFWDQKKDLIYTDRFVKITTEDQIIQGYGLESDPRLTRRKIKNLSATIYINDEN